MSFGKLTPILCTTPSWAAPTRKEPFGSFLLACKRIKTRSRTHFQLEDAIVDLGEFLNVDVIATAGELVEQL